MKLEVWVYTSSALLTLNRCSDCLIIPGSQYPDVSSPEHKKDDSIPPGGNHTYTWTIPEGHSPTADDTNCLTWIYHSHIDAPKDVASGLIGPLLTCKEGNTVGRGELRVAVSHIRDFIMISNRLGQAVVATQSAPLLMWNFGLR